jgi:hypothetical protein
VKLPISSVVENTWGNWVLRLLRPDRCRNPRPAAMFFWRNTPA